MPEKRLEKTRESYRENTETVFRKYLTVKWIEWVSPEKVVLHNHFQGQPCALTCRIYGWSLKLYSKTIYRAYRAVV